MTKYSISYQQEHCIDVYFKLNGVKVHILTDGTLIPDNLNDRDRNRSLQKEVSILEPDTFDEKKVIINEKFLKHLKEEINQFNLEGYQLPCNTELLRMHIPVSQLGFYSYDCIQELQEGKGRYMLVSSPNPDENYPEIDINLPEYNILGTEGIPEELII